MPRNALVTGGHAVLARQLPKRSRRPVMMSSRIMAATTRRRRNSRPRPASRYTNGTCLRSKPAAVPKDVLENSILPTIPIGRLSEPEEIGRRVVFLAGDDAG